MIFAKLFEKKPNEKTIAKFWNELQTRSDFYLDVIVKDDEDTDDYIFVRSCIKDGLKRCCIDAEVAYDFSFDTESEPMRFVFHHANDAYLKRVGESLAKQYPASLKEKMLFLTAE